MEIRDVNGIGDRNGELRNRGDSDKRNKTSLTYALSKNGNFPENIPAPNLKVSRGAVFYILYDFYSKNETYFSQSRTLNLHHHPIHMQHTCYPETVQWTNECFFC